MAGQTLWDQLIAGAGDAITDIRQKLVEEPWYGRALDVKVSDLAQNPGDFQPSSGKDQNLASAIQHNLRIER